MSRFAKKIFGHILYLVTYLFPRNKKKWVFWGGNGKFTGNPKYLFFYVANNHKDKVDAVWLSKYVDIVELLRKNGYKSYHITSIKGIWATLSAGYCFKDAASSGSLNVFLSGGSKTINLYHGCAIKKIGWDRVRPSYKKTFRYALGRFIRRLLSKCDYVIVTSAKFQEIFSSAYDINKDKVIIAGYPRNDVFFKKVSGEGIGLSDSLLSEIEHKRGNKGKVILYAPTFRDSRLSGSNAVHESGLDLAKLNLLMQEKGALLLLKLHAGARLKKLTESYNNIIFIPSELDVNLLLRITDALITDYSSIYFDFLLLDRPVIFFPYDFENYVTRERGLYFDYDKILAGPKVYKFDGLFAEVKKLLENYEVCSEKYRREREKIKNMAFKYVDGDSSERIFNFFKP
jgi:CDP-glycerol glycerophosphotransferase (TagB/SpsB family)